jgi:O-antigen/teichoic acid export membrane protein
VKSAAIASRFTGSAGSLRRGVAVIASGNAMAQLIVLAGTPILTRIYSPQEFGVLSVYTSILMTMVVLASLRWELAIPLPEEEREALALCALCLIALASTTVLFAIGLGTAESATSTWGSLQTFRRYIWLLPVGLVVLGLYQIGQYWAVRTANFRAIARARVGKSIVQVSSQVASAGVFSSPGGLIGGLVAGHGASTVLVIRGVRISRIFRQKFTRRELREVAGKYKRFPLLATWSSLLNSLGLYLPAVLIAGFYGTLTAGWLALGQKIIGNPLFLLRDAVAQVYLSEAPKRLRSDPWKLRALFRQTALRLLAVGAPIVVLLAVVGPLAFSSVFGSRWAEAGVFVRGLSVFLLAQFIVTPLSQTLVALQRQDLQLGWDFLRLVCTAGVIVIAGLAHFAPATAVYLYSAVGSAMYLTLFLIIDRVLRRICQASDKLAGDKT